MLEYQRYLARLLPISAGEQCVFQKIRAKAKGINIIQKINLPKGMNTDENDLSVLVANLLENALLASANGQEPRQKLCQIGALSRARALPSWRPT